MGDASYRIEVLHGVNLDMLGHRDPAVYGTLTLARAGDADRGVRRRARLARCASSRRTPKAELIERLHRLRGEADGIVLNPGAWTHYAWAIRDALEIAALPTVEVHLSDVKAREPWRRVSVVEDLCVASVSGQGPEGYRVALERLRGALEAGRR